MPVFYVRSTDGDNADNGSTWALAKATLAGAFAAAAAGDTIWVSESHAENNAATVALTSPGTAPAPVYVLCGNDAAEPPTALATTAVVKTTGDYVLNFSGHAYYYGITFQSGDTSTAHIYPTFGSGTATQGYVFDNCRHEILSTSNASEFRNDGARDAVLRLHNSVFKLSNAGQRIRAMSRFYWKGGSLDVTTAVPGYLFHSNSGQGGDVVVEGVDLSGLNTSLVLANTAGITARFNYYFKNCRLHASVIALNATRAFNGPGHDHIYVDNCDSGNTNYRMDHRKYEGSIVTETTIKRTGGASDGTTGLSWKMVSLATGPSFLYPLESPPIAVWNDTTGSAKTLTVEIVHDSETALTNGEVWVEIEHLGTASYSQSVHASDRKASFVATAADQTASVVDWTTTGLTNPNKQALAVSFTPQHKGPVVARVMLAKANYTVYVCPKVTIS